MVPDQIRMDQDGVHVLSFPTNVANVPIEVLENDAPIMVTRKSLAQNSGGTGKYRGGLGQVFGIKHVGKEPINISILTEKTKTQAHGICGGDNGASGQIRIIPERPIAPKGLDKFYPGEEIIFTLPGGGGYGPKENRSRKAIQRDKELGYIS